MAKQFLVITILSDDHPGVVKLLAKTISDHGGSWLESRMSQLAGKFAGILKVTIDDSQITSLAAALTQLKARGIQVLIDRAFFQEHDASKSTPKKTFSFELVGADNVGIVHELSQAFTDKGISIDELETYCSSMPWSGEPLFQANGKLLAPETTNTHELLEQLDNIADNLGVDISLTEKF